MFTGIITEVGTVKLSTESEKGKTLIISAGVANSKKIGESIAVNGVCLTITSKKSDEFECEAVFETLEKTNLSSLEKGSKVNLEPALTFNQSIDGHLVQGHVDTTGEVKGFKKGEKSQLVIQFPKDIAKYIALKGSITINGVSLTISDLKASTFTVDLIPHTIEKTNLGKLKKGDKVNLEVDLISRYLKRLLDARDKQSTYQFLEERGFI